MWAPAHVMSSPAAISTISIIKTSRHWAQSSAPARRSVKQQHQQLVSRAGVQLPGRNRLVRKRHATQQTRVQPTKGAAVCR